MTDHFFNAAQKRLPLGAELQVALNLVPTHTWYTNPTGGLTFVNERCADYLGLPKDHPLRLGIDTEAAWDSHIPLLHPDDHEEARRVWSTCLRTGCAGQVSFRVRNAEGGYRWFLSRLEPVRATDGTLLYWIGVNLNIEDRKQVEFYLAEGQRLARTDSWAFNAAGFDYWSPELFQIHGLDPNRKAPTVEEYLALVHSDDREFVAETIQTMFADPSRPGRKREATDLGQLRIESFGKARRSKRQCVAPFSSLGFSRSRNVTCLCVARNNGLVPR